MESEAEINQVRADRMEKIKRVIEHAEASVELWGPEKTRDATLTFYSRSRGAGERHRADEEFVGSGAIRNAFSKTL